MHFQSFTGSNEAHQAGRPLSGMSGPYRYISALGLSAGQCVHQFVSGFHPWRGDELN